MKMIIVFAAIIAVAIAGPVDSKDAVILRSDYENSESGYKYAFETSDGISKAEQGDVTDLGAEDQSIVVRGTYSYVGPDNVVYTVNYIADDNGFQPIGAHIPTA